MCSKRNLFKVHPWNLNVIYEKACSQTTFGKSILSCFILGVFFIYSRLQFIFCSSDVAILRISKTLHSSHLGL